MARNNNTSYDRTEIDEEKVRTSAPTRDHLTPGEKMKDPVRCAMCLAVLWCPRIVDYEDFMVRKNLKCLDSNDQNCAVAVKNTRNKDYIKRITSVRN